MPGLKNVGNSIFSGIGNFVGAILPSTYNEGEGGKSWNRHEYL